MIKVGDRLTIDGKLVEVTYVMNDSCYSYKPVTEISVDKVDKVDKVEEPKEEAPRRRRRKV